MLFGESGIWNNTSHVYEIDGNKQNKIHKNGTFYKINLIILAIYYSNGKNMR